MTRPPRAGALAVGVNAGGTFTDFIAADGRAVKVPSDAGASGRVMADGLEALLRERPVARLDVLHGTTVATNALLTGDLAPTGLLVTRGFRDVLTLGRQNRPDLYALAPKRAFAPPARALTFEITERLDAAGRRLTPIALSEVRRAGAALKRAGVATVAVCFLNSYANPAHEIAAARVLEGMGFLVTASAALVAEYREYERFSTAYANAALRPLVRRYVEDLVTEFPRLEREFGLESPIGMRLLHSSGGLIGASAAAEAPVRLVLSGPAGGLVGAWGACATRGRRRLVTFDMGGTSTDVALLDGGLETTGQTRIAGRPLLVPVLDVHTVGAGGGSIAKKAAGGALTVGPASAGANPGPAAYGRGGPLTVTDANLFLGRLVSDRFLGGTMRLDPAASAAAVRGVARSLGLDDRECALGVLAIAEVTMARAVRTISLERGHDPRLFSLVAFGGAGPLHAAAVAARLGLKETLCPPNPGLLSAQGMLWARAQKETSKTVLGKTIAEIEEDADRIFRPLEAEALSALAADGVKNDVLVERSADLRYRGQSYELNVPVGRASSAAAAFVRLHEKRYGFRLAKDVEVVTIRVRAFGPAPKIAPPRLAKHGKRSPIVERREVVFESGAIKTPVLDRALLGAGFTCDGPAIVVEYSATTVCPPDHRLSVETDGTLVLTPAEGRA